MARLFTSGFELNTTTANLEWTANTGSPSIQTTTKRNGSYALEITSLSAITKKGLLYQFVSSTNTGPFYARFYFRYHTLPGANSSTIAGLSAFNSLVNNAVLNIRFTSSGTLQLLNSTTQIGSDSSALTADTWYCIEVLFDNTGGVGNGIFRAKLNGTEFASATNLTPSSNVESFMVGGNLLSENNTAGDWFFDDIAINDSNGSAQTSYPGEGNVVVLRPSAAGDNTGWSPLAGSNFSSVNEVTPDSATSYVQSNTSGQIDDYNIDDPPSGMGDNDVVNVVAVSAQFAISSTTGSDPDAVLRVKATSGGTVSESGNISGSGSTSYNVNTLAVPHTAPLTTYLDPSSAAWTKAKLTSAQIGVRESASDTHFIRISALWMTVDYAQAPTVALSSPADSATGVSTTPDLVFTGTDPEGADITYEVEVDTVNTFDSSQSLGSLITSYATTNYAGNDELLAGGGGNHTGNGESFMGDGSTLGGVQFFIWKTGSPTGNVVAKVYAHSGTFGTSSVPTGTALAVSNNVDASTLDSGTNQLVTFYFSGANAITLANGTNYVVTIEYSGGDGSNTVNVGYDNSSPTYAGNMSYNSSGWTAFSTGDLIFYLYAYNSAPLIDATSTSGGHDAAQFSGTPDNTDPYTSGQAVTFTVPGSETLTASTTYYWRVRGKDPSGSNTFGVWATTRSFTTASGGGGGGGVRVTVVPTGMLMGYGF